MFIVPKAHTIIDYELDMGSLRAVVFHFVGTASTFYIIPIYLGVLFGVSLLTHTIYLPIKNKYCYFFFLSIKTNIVHKNTFLHLVTNAAFFHSLKTALSSG